MSCKEQDRFERALRWLSRVALWDSAYDVVGDACSAIRAFAGPCSEPFRFSHQGPSATRSRCFFSWIPSYRDCFLAPTRDVTFRGFGTSRVGHPLSYGGFCYRLQPWLTSPHLPRPFRPRRAQHPTGATIRLYDSEHSIHTYRGFRFWKVWPSCRRRSDPLGQSIRNQLAQLPQSRMLCLL